MSVIGVNCRTVGHCHWLWATIFLSPVAALVLCRLDYGNGTLVGLPANLVRRLQSVQNTAARLV